MNQKEAEEYYFSRKVCLYFTSLLPYTQAKF